MIFLSEMKEELSTHIMIVAEQFQRLTRNKSRASIVEYALRSNVTGPASCIQNGITGEHFWDFIQRKKLPSVRTPKSTLLGRASNFN